MVTSLSLPPFNYFLINFITFSLFFLFLIKKFDQKKNKKKSFFYGWLFGFGYFSTNLYWISISLTFDKNFQFLIPFTMILIPSFLAIFYGLLTYVFSIINSKKIISSFLIFSLIFSIVEFIRGSVLTGFPWNLIAFTFSNQLEILSITSILGTYGFNLFCITLFTSPAILILKNRKREILFFLLILSITTFFHIFGSISVENFKKEKNVDSDYKIRVISSNISLKRYYSNLDPSQIIEELIEISEPKENEKTIFIWPEGIIPTYLDNLDKYKNLFSEKFNKNHLIVLGINRLKNENQISKVFNSIAVYDNEINLLDSYDKINLVPFGEFLPMENFLKRIGLRSLTNNYQSFSNGDKRNIIDFSKKNFSIRILPLICYEIIYSGKLFMTTDFDLIINISEDGWFGKSIGPKQHFVHSIFRAIESGKYIVRSANNGITAIINPVGVIEQRVNYGQSGYVDFMRSKKLQPTVFSKYGNKVFGLLILLYILIIFSFNKIRDE